MNILLTITGLSMGGAENQVVSLADELASRGHKVTLVYMLEPVLLTPRSNQVELIWLGGTKSINGVVKAYINLAKVVKRVKPDVVHSHLFHANMLARLVRLVCKIPRLICSAHNANDGGTIRMLAYRLTNGLAHEFTNVSRDATKAYEIKKATPSGRMLTIHNGIDTQRFRFNLQACQRIRTELGINGNKIFIAIGRFHRAKDYPNLLTAFSQLISERSQCHLLIVGDGDLRGQIESQIVELDLQAKVTLLGIRQDVPELLSAADIFVLSSVWEGFGLVVAEAMATERIVIATNCGGVAEVMGDKGFLVEPQNSNALAAAMYKALNLCQEEAEQLGKLGRQRIKEKYSLGAVIDRWEKIYVS